MVENLPANAGDIRDTGSIPGSGRSPGIGNGNPQQYSSLENSMDRETWWAAVHGVMKSWARLSTAHIRNYRNFSAASLIFFSCYIRKCI